MTMNTELIDRYDMLPAGTKVLCALSGGRDSVFLLYRLLELAPERQLTVGAAHVNHLLRGKESDRDEAFVRDLCEKEDVPLFVGRRDAAAYAAQHRLGPEEAAREVRYAFLEETRQTAGYDVIATAHHAGDQAETVLLNLLRGAGTKGLAGIPPVRGRIIRPILNVSRREIDGYLTARNLPFVEDSTNAEDVCARNVLRGRVIPALEALNPAFQEHAAVAADLLREDEQFLDSLAEDFLQTAFDGESVDAHALAAQPKPVASRAVRRLWGEGLSLHHVDSILAACTGTERKLIRVPGGTAVSERGRLYLREAPAAAPESVELTDPAGELVWGTMHIAWQTLDRPREIHNSFTNFDLKYESINGTVHLTSRQPGDAFRPAGRGCTKSLKALFQERGLTERQRALTPVFRDAEGIAAVYGSGIAQRCVPEREEKVIRIWCEEYNKR